jgi:hypothetical protein
VVGEAHRGGEGAVASLLGDEAVHPLADAAVRGVALRRRAQLDHVHRLPRVQLHVEADAVGHRHRVRRDLGEPRRGDRVVEVGRLAEDPAPVALGARLGDRLRHHGAVARREALPLERQEPVALQVAERAVIREEVEAVGRALERAARFVAPVRAPADVGREHGRALRVGHLSRARQQNLVGKV